MNFASSLWGFIRSFLLPYIPIPVEKYIGSYGPFKFQLQFFNCNFRNFSSSHNGLANSFFALARHSKCIVDVGGHIGLTSLPVSSFLKGDQTLHIFEPSSTNFKLLCYHHKINKSKNSYVYNLALGHSDDSLSFYQSRATSPMHSVSKNFAPPSSFKTVIKQISLDSFVQDYSLCPDLVKIDVEGYEYNVLLGMSSILSSYNPILILSLHPSRIQDIGESVDKLVRYLHRFNYFIFDSSFNKVESPVFGEYYAIRLDQLLKLKQYLK